MTARFAHTLPWGAEIVDGGARFRLWAPAQGSVSLATETGATIPMTKQDAGWFDARTDAVPAGSGYPNGLPTVLLTGLYLFSFLTTLCLTESNQS